MRVYYDADADLNLIKGKKVAVVGYGSQGFGHSNNLKDSGVAEVAVALKQGSATRQKVEAAGLKCMTPSEAARWADVVMVLVPDELQADLWKDELADNMKEGAALLFAHGFNIHFKLIEPRPDLDVLMVAPKGPGHLVRRQFVDGNGVPGLVAIHQDSTGRARDLVLAYARGIGCTRAGVIETTFKDETETDLFGEQVVLCGGLTALIKSAFDTLVSAGYPPEIAYFECVHEVKLLADLLHEGGLTWMHHKISNTAEYGEYTRGPRVIGEQSRAEMRKILARLTKDKYL